MTEPTYIACPRCGEPFPMSAMQKRLFVGRTLSCNRCAKPFSITDETPDPVPARTMRGNSPVPQSLMTPQTAPPAPPPVASQPRVPPPPSPNIGAAQAAQPAPRPGDGLTAGRMALLIAVVVVAVGVLLFMAIAPAVHRAREAARRSSCASNLIQVGFALQRYTNNNGGRYPDSLHVLVLDGSLPAELLLCPSSKDTVAPGTSPGEQAASLANESGHESYVYLGKDMRVAPAKRVVAFESLADHENEGVNVLYSDGSVQFLTRSAALTAIPELSTPSSQPVATTQPAAAAP
jgi:hypothetical protein